MEHKSTETKNSQHPNITKTAAIFLNVTVKITIIKVGLYYDSTIKYLNTGQAPNKKCSAALKQSTCCPHPSALRTMPWCAAHPSRRSVHSKQLFNWQVCNAVALRIKAIIYDNMIKWAGAT